MDVPDTPRSPQAARPGGPAPTLIALAGLPGTGKSRLAAALAEALAAPVLDKDRVRHALFGSGGPDPTRAQDDFVMRVLYRTAVFLGQGGAAHVILDGRPFVRPGQLDELRALADGLRWPLVVLECRCPPAVAEARLEDDARTGRHPAPDRGVALYRRLAAEAVPLAGPRLVLETGEAQPAELVARVRAHLAAVG